MHGRITHVHNEVQHQSKLLGDLLGSNGTLHPLLEIFLVNVSQSPLRASTGHIGRYWTRAPSDHSASRVEPSSKQSLP